MDTADTHSINFTVMIFLYLHALSNMTTQTHRIAKTAGIEAHTGPPATSNIYPPNSKARGIRNSMSFNSSFIAANGLGYRPCHARAALREESLGDSAVGGGVAVGYGAQIVPALALQLRAGERHRRRGRKFVLSKVAVEPRAGALGDAVTERACEVGAAQRNYLVKPQTPERRVGLLPEDGKRA